MGLSKCIDCGASITTTTSTKKNPYLYKECGLDDVRIDGIKVHKCSKCGRMYPEIPKIKELHRVLASLICSKDGKVTGKEVKFIRKEMRMKSVEFAKLLGITSSYMSRIENETKVISSSLDKLIRTLFIIYASEDLSLAICKGTVSRLTDIPAIKTNHAENRFSLKKKDWMSSHGNQLCYAC